jgi:outer membrane protein assembly factor BamB
MREKRIAIRVSSIRKKGNLMRLFVLLILCTQFLHAAILSNWRGPNRDGQYNEENLLDEWPADGPKEVWSFSGLGKGHTSAAVTKDHVFVTGVLDETGYLFAFDKSGELLWKKAYGSEWTRNYAGTRSTPIVVDELLYFLSGQGEVICSSAKDGNSMWSINMHEKFKAPVLDWGISEQLLVDGDKVYCTPGGASSIVALNRFTGKTIWQAENNGETASYCSPILARHGGKNMLITMLEKSVIAVDADSGELLWRHPHIAPYDIHANIPIYHSGFVYFQAGEGGTGQLLRVAPDGSSVSVVWESNSLDTLTGATLLVDGFIYGSGYLRNGFQCLEWKTGEPKYVTDELKRASVIYADGNIIAYSERGTVALIRANPHKFELLSSFNIKRGSGPHWAHPVVNDGRLYIRHEDVLMVYDIAK